MKKLLLVLIAAVFLFYAALNVFLLLGGKNIIAGRVAALSGKKTTIGFCFIRPPIVIGVRNIKIEGLIKADYFSCSISPLSLLYGKRVLNNLVLIKPEVYYEIKPQAGKAEGEGVVIPQAAETKPSSALPVVLRGIKIKQGSFDILDYRPSGAPVKILARDVEVDLGASGLKLNAKLPWSNGKEEGKIEASARFSPLEKKGAANINITNVDGAAVYYYYSNWLDLEDSGIQSARLNFSSDANLTKGNLKAACKLAFSDIVTKPKEGEEGQTDLSKVFIQDKITFNFSLVSKFTGIKFRLGNIDLILLDNLL